MESAEMNFSSLAHPVGAEMPVINWTLFKLSEHKVALGIRPIITNGQALSLCLFNVNRHDFI